MNTRPRRAIFSYSANPEMVAEVAIHDLSYALSHLDSGLDALRALDDIKDDGGATPAVVMLQTIRSQAEQARERTAQILKELE